MATASAIEIKRAADQQRAADELAEVKAQLARLEQMVTELHEALTAPKTKAQRAA